MEVYLGQYEVIFTIILSALTIFISAVAIRISLSIGRNQLKVDLFEKRYELYSFVMNFLDKWDFVLKREIIENNRDLYICDFLNYYCNHNELMKYYDVERHAIVTSNDDLKEGIFLDFTTRSEQNDSYLPVTATLCRSFR